MGTHPIFESDFDCLTEWKESSIICELIMQNLLSDFQTRLKSPRFPAQFLIARNVSDRCTRVKKCSRPLVPKLSWLISESRKCIRAKFYHSRQFYWVKLEKIQKRKLF